MSADTAIKVAVRIRPIVKSEEARGCQVIVEKTPSQPQVIVQTERPEAYTFNYVFSPEDTQDQIYEDAVKSMIQNLFKGKKQIKYKKAVEQCLIHLQLSRL